MTDPMPDRCPAIEPGFGVLERCVFHVGHGGYHLAGGAWPIEETTRRCTAAGAITGGRCVLPGGHDEDDGTAHLFAVPGGSAQAVEGSTPIASPAQCGHGIAVAGDWLQCQNTPDHDGLHISGRRRWRTGGTLEPAPVPPPVDALLETAPLTITRLGYDRFTEAFSRGDHKQALACATDAVWAAGVAEGQRLLDETAATAAAHAYELGIAEGRRQATEERTEEQWGDVRD